MPELQPIPDTPAVMINHKRILVVADLHIGIEHELEGFGLRIPSRTEQLLTRLISLVDHYAPKDIVFLGDVKHTIPQLSYQERKDVHHFLQKIRQYSQVHVVPGNHDGNIKYLIPDDCIIHRSEGCILHGYGFTHGHRWPSKEVMTSQCIFVGHTHPTIQLTDRRGYATYEPCWLRGISHTLQFFSQYNVDVIASIVVVPAFNPFCGGIAVNREPLVGPFSKLLNRQETEVYLLDGTFLGKLETIK